MMDRRSVCTGLFFVFVSLTTVSCNKIKKLELGIKVLKEKFSNLEDKIYKDEIDLRYEIENVWKLLNESSDDKDPKEKPGDINAADEILSDVNNVDTVLKNVEDRTKLMLKGFATEKAIIRDYIKKFENEVEIMRNLHEYAISDLRNSSYELSMQTNASLAVGLHEVNHQLERHVTDMMQKQQYQFEELNIVNNELYAGLQESIINWNNDSMTSLEQSFDVLKINQDKNMVSFMTKASETLQSFKDTIEDGQEKARSAQDKAERKSLEFEEMVKVVKVASDECKKRTDAIQQSVEKLQTLVTCSTKDWYKFEDSCYKLSTTSVQWEEAADECSKIGAYLVEVNSIEENQYIAKTFLKKGTIVWLGGSDLDSEGQWVWKKSKYPLGYQGWQKSEPNGGVLENCLHIYEFNQDGVWNDINCARYMPYLCEMNVLLNM